MWVHTLGARRRVGRCGPLPSSLLVGARALSCAPPSPSRGTRGRGDARAVCPRETGQTDSAHSYATFTFAVPMLLLRSDCRRVHSRFVHAMVALFPARACRRFVVLEVRPVLVYSDFCRVDPHPAICRLAPLMISRRVSMPSGRCPVACRVAAGVSPLFTSARAPPAQAVPALCNCRPTLGARCTGQCSFCIVLVLAISPCYIRVIASPLE